jgi:hypothetical protein
VSLSMLPGGCTCEGAEPRCKACVEQAMFWGAGTAEVRGESWARRVAAAGYLDRDWPAYHHGDVAAIARRQVAGMSNSEVILEALAQRCHRGAAREWERLRARPGPGAVPGR